MSGGATRVRISVPKCSLYVCFRQLVGLALAEACDCNNEEVLRLLLKIWKGRCSALQAQPLLRSFAARGDAATVARLLAQGPASMVQMDTQQRARLASTGLAHAAGEMTQRAKVLSTLLQAGAEPRGQHGEIALRNAARDGQSESMQLLLHEGTNVNAVDDDGKTVLCVAACSGCCEGVRCLLEHGALVRMRCHDGREPLDFAVDESVRQLLLAEVEKLRMGLLDELLADDGADGGKAKGKKARKGGKEAKKAKDTKATDSSQPTSAGHAPIETGADAAERHVEGQVAQSKSAKKKLKKAASKSAAGAGLAASSPAEAHEADACEVHLTAADASVGGNPSAAAPPSPKKASAARLASGLASDRRLDEETGRGLASTPSLLETAIQLLSGQARRAAPFV